MTVKKPDNWTPASSGVTENISPPQRIAGAHVTPLNRTTLELVSLLCTSRSLDAHESFRSEDEKCGVPSQMSTWLSNLANYIKVAFESNTSAIGNGPIILNLGQETVSTPEQTPRHLTTSPHQLEDIES
ncbi:hypothetical protein TNCV_4429141 [Trichonephila clavipes]|nr:hypothetical protein TNCV_4429141 [Trichonephila clavipes]